METDRENKYAIELRKHLTVTGNALINTVTVSEILTGSFLRSDCSRCREQRPSEYFDQSSWTLLNGEIEKLVAKLNAYGVQEILVRES